ncbi:MAG: hypothetical protein FJ291_14505 [Planctomycetes bacterium]|nr:hypothetical protein [Planctomycetota bacterium]
MRAPVLCVSVALSCWCLAAEPVGAKSGGRHGAYSKKAAQGPHMKVLAATYFGSEGCEEFVAAGAMPDGTAVAFGNAWGPQFPESPKPTLLGSGKHAGQPAVVKDNKGNDVPNRKSADAAGMIAFFAPGLKSIARVVRFDWGVATIEAGIVAGDGKGLVIAGRCQPGFASFARLAPSARTLPYQPPAEPPKGGRKPKPPPDPATLADVYVARLASDAKVGWLWVLEKNNDPPEALFADSAGAVYFDAAGLRRVSPDGKELTLFSPRSGTGQAKWLGVDPLDGTAYFGGDRNSSTGREPYRNPYFYKIVGGTSPSRDTRRGDTPPTDEIVWRLWEFPSREIGADDCRLVSDSSARALAFARDGDLLIGGWSDGGNSVFPRQATDWRKPASRGGMGMETSGMKGANSLAHIMRIDPKTRETKSHTWWASYVPSWFTDARHRGAPNFANIRQIAVLDDGSVAIAGAAATGLIQTPGAFWEDPMTGDRYGGDYAAIFRPDLSNLRFSSYLPGCSDAALGTWKNGLIIVSRSKGSDGLPKPTPSPAVNAIQRDFIGAFDAHIILLENP